MKQIIDNNKAWIDETWSKIDQKLSKVAVKSRDKIPYTTVNGVHDNRAAIELDWWTNGFWGGMMWLMYNATKKEEYKRTALSADEILEGALADFKILHHDVGFLWYITSGARYRLTGDKRSYNKTLYIASMLASRYNIDGGYILAWNGANEAGWSIIDSMMNIPLLYWASEEVGNPRFKRIATHHADMILRDHIREDGSVNHIVEHDTETGAVNCIPQGQGYSPDSCWTRGLAWAVYGTILSYIHTGKQEYLDAAKKTASYFIDNVKETDYKTPIDFKGPKEPVYYDSTAGVCAACGMLEIAKCVAEEEAKVYTQAVINILKATDEHFADYSDDQDALVLMGSEMYPHKSDKGLHIPIIYADFFYVEAILKLKGSDFLIW